MSLIAAAVRVAQKRIRDKQASWKCPACKETSEPKQVTEEGRHYWLCRQCGHKHVNPN